MAQHPEAVKATADYLRAFAERVSARPQWQEEMRAHAGRLDAAADEMVRLMGLTSALPPDLGNIFDLPQELLDELAVTKGDELDDQLVTTINSYGGTANLDQILVGLFRKFGVRQKRRFLQTRLYRLPMVWTVEGVRGVYTTVKPAEKPKELPAPEPEPARSAGTYNTYGGSDLDDDIPF